MSGSSPRSESTSEILASALRLYDFLCVNGWEGYDPYDGLNSRLLASISTRSRWLRILLVHANRASPVNLRGILGIKKGTNLKGVGLLASAFLKLHAYTGEDEFLTTASSCLELLKSRSLKDRYSGHCWIGAYSKVEMRCHSGTADIPSLICTVVCGCAFLEHYEITGEEESLAVAKSCARFLASTLFVKDGTRAFFMYAPTAGVDWVVYNACTHGAMLLSRIDKYSTDGENLEIAREVMDYVVTRQKPDGAWAYSERAGKERMQIDFHQGFILDDLHDFIGHAGAVGDRYSQALAKGVEFYRKEQFLPDGRAKWRWPRVYPIDIHNQAQGIITFSKLSEISREYLAFAEDIAVWTIRNMQDETGYFYYQKWPFLINKVPYLRWGQAWMMLALSNLLERMSAGDPKPQSCSVRG